MRHCILVVEDNQLNCELLRDWLEVESYEVWCAADLQASYEVFAKQLLDVVLLDINLGKADGLDLLAWMRQNPETREIPVIAVTAHALVDGAAAHPECGLPSVSVETNRLSTASSGTKALAARLRNAAAGLLDLLDLAHSFSRIAFTRGAIACLHGFLLSTMTRSMLNLSVKSFARPAWTPAF